MEQIGVLWSLKDCTDIGIFPFSLNIAIINISIFLQTLNIVNSYTIFILVLYHLLWDSYAVYTFRDL